MKDGLQDLSIDPTGSVASWTLHMTWASTLWYVNRGRTRLAQRLHFLTQQNYWSEITFQNNIQFLFVKEDYFSEGNHLSWKRTFQKYSRTLLVLLSGILLLQVVLVSASNVTSRWLAVEMFATDMYAARVRWFPADVTRAALCVVNDVLWKIWHSRWNRRQCLRLVLLVGHRK